MPYATPERISRRTMIGAATSAAICVLGSRFAVHSVAAQESAKEESAKGAQIVDTHIHVVTPHLPGVPTVPAPDGTALEASVERLADTIRTEMKNSGTVAAFCMPQYGELAPNDILGIERTLALKELVPNLHAVGIADPQRTTPTERKQIETIVAQGQVRALKCYLGYVHAMPSDSGYAWYFRLAQKYKIPVIFHTGDTYSKKAKLKYAHPLGVDEVAVDHPNCRFVIAHLGNPWMIDAAEVIYKNENVWADLSGLVVGDGSTFKDDDWEHALDDIASRALYALHYTEKPNRILYGSDWPLIPMAGYRKFVAGLLPKEWHEAAFEGNARNLFQRISEC